MSLVPLISYFSLALGASFLCSLLEAVILSVSHSHIEAMVERGRAGGRVLRRLKDRIDRPLAAILTLNTLSHTIGATGVGAQTAALARHYGSDEDFWVGIAGAVVTVAILVLSEIIPKTIGAAYWKSIAGPAAYVIQVLIVVLLPVVVALEWIARAFSKSGYPQGITREEVRIIARLGGEGGELDPAEARVITNLFGMKDLKAADVMTPRVEVVALQKDLTAEQALTERGRLRYSRLPIYGEDIDDVRGMVLRSQLLETVVEGKGATKIEALASPVVFVPETKSIASLLEEFIERNEHLFVVVDEFGGVEGIVTLEDTIETLLGVEIVDELDTVADLRKLARSRLKERQRRLAQADRRPKK